MPDKKKKSVSVIRSSAIIKNPVLFEAIGIAPVVAMAVSLKSAIILSFVSLVELLLIECLACLLMKKLKGSVRKMIYAILGLLINIPLFMLFRYLAPNETASAGIFLPLLAVNSLIALHCERFAVKHNFKATALDAVSAGFSYAAVILIVGVVREILGSGTVYSVKLNIPVKLPGLLMPFGGFLLLGFMAAALKAIINKKYPEKHPDASFDLSEVKQSHVIKLREFLDTDLDFFELGEEEPQNEKEKPHTDKKKSSAAKRKAPSLSVKKTASAPAKSKKVQSKTAQAEAAPPTPSGKKTKTSAPPPNSKRYSRSLRNTSSTLLLTAAQRHIATRTKARKRTAARKHNNKRAVKTNECHSKSFFGSDVRICASKPDFYRRLRCLGGCQNGGKAEAAFPAHGVYHILFDIRQYFLCTA